MGMVYVGSNGLSDMAGLSFHFIGEDDFSLSMDELYALCLPLNVPGDIHA